MASLRHYDPLDRHYGGAKEERTRDLCASMVLKLVGKVQKRRCRCSS